MSEEQFGKTLVILGVALIVGCIVAVIFVG